MSYDRLRIATLSAACLIATAPAFGQGMMSGTKPVVGTAPTAAKEAPPPALPGSRAESMEAAPASKLSLDLPPTEALFDAVNRGDLAAAKDAISRGADTNGHNVLGLTPLDLAIDLGRNQITFILLSLRNPEAPATPDRASAAKLAAANPPTRAARREQHRHVAERSPAPRQTLVRQAGYTVATARKAASEAPRRFAGDGGTPNPGAGFLGFGSTTR